MGDHLFDTLAIKDINELPETLHDQPAVTELKRLFKLLEASGVSNAIFDMSIMRGFDYYTDIVFEMYDTDPENARALFGGGRYDGLVGLFGVEPVPTVGFGMGDVMLEKFLESHNLLPKLHQEVDIYVVLVGDSYDAAQKSIADLREMGLNVAVDASERKVGDKVKNAVKQGAHYALFIGEKELEEEQFTLKNLDTNVEEKHGLQRIVSVVKDYRKQ
jgi:histidyl-tRNA synthetase